MNHLFPLLMAGITLTVASSAAFAATDPALEQNKKTVSAFYTLAFNDHKPAEAMQKYVGPKYIQHNPFAGDGKQAFIDYFTDFFKKHPKVRIEIKRLIAEKDLVVVHVHSLLGDDLKELGRAVVDLFRLENGKIVEHWDVAQPIPEKAANPNTMF